ncbi:MAG TPA: gamma carbonic anhydrase family protein [Hyphomicrobiales bacterium]|nr:gamma carbonic anhydrase family protein [Hyphomicrobiales bacterium]
MITSYKGVSPRIAESAYIAASADLIGDVEIHQNVSIWYQVVLRGDIGPIRVGRHSNIQDGSVLHSVTGVPVNVGDWVTVGHRAILHGCTVEDHCLIGMGAIVLNGARVSEGSIVAAGALVLENTVIPPGSLYVGVPAKLRRKLNDEDRAFIDAHAGHYLEYKEIYLAETGSQTTP